MERVSVTPEVVGADIGLVRPIGNESIAVITRLNPTEEHVDNVGNILRRTCEAAGELSCQAVCQLRGNDPEEYERNEFRKCADRNLRQGLDELGIAPGDVLMVAVTGDEVGFGDKLADYQQDGLQSKNPEGWTELKGFNAFFARYFEGPAIGSRLADCAHLEFEFLDKFGNTVVGFQHGTRTNMRGESKQGSQALVKDKPGFDADGEPASYTEHVLSRAIEHYEADPDTINIRLGSSIKAENFTKKFPNREKMENVFPGWLEAGFLHNTTNPNWKPGDTIIDTDEWAADARGMILHDIEQTMNRLGIPKENFTREDMVDPADTDGEYSSNQNKAKYGDTRDLYLVAHQDAFATMR
jgi:hypothetical protein